MKKAAKLQKNRSKIVNWIIATADIKKASRHIITGQTKWDKTFVDKVKVKTNKTRF